VEPLGVGELELGVTRLLRVLEAPADHVQRHQEVAARDVLLGDEDRAFPE